MKKHLFLLIITLAVLMPSTFAQITDYVVIGTKTQSSTTAPFNQSYKYSYSECIYPKSSFSGPVTIYSLSYNCAKVKALTITDFKIYLGVTTKSSNGSNNWTPEQELTLVYDHSNVVVGQSTGWQEITLDTPYLYDATKNLVVVIAKKGKVSNSTLAYYFTNTTNSIMYRHSKTDESYANYPGSASSTSTTNFRANIKIGVGPYQAACDKPTDLAQIGATAHSVSINWKPAEDTDSWDVYIGENPSSTTAPTATVSDTTYTFNGLIPAEQYFCYVRTNCGESTSDWVPLQTMTDPDFTGEGTEENPYLIYTLDNINTIIYAMEHNWSTYGKYFRLMDDIETLTRPIGTDNVLFRGDFDGNGHFITLDLNGEQFQALFSRLGIGANVHDVNVDGSITSTGNYTGGICAIISEAGGHSAENIHITNCTNYATINARTRVGGIIGMSNLSSQTQYTKLYIENCVNRGTIICTEGFIGGIAGVLVNNAIIDGCYNRAEITGSSTIGGVFGEIDKSTARNCYNKADITSFGSTTAESVVGGIGGSLYNSNLYNSYSIGNISGINGVGGLLGEFMNAITTDTYEMKNVYVSGNITASPETNRKGMIIGDIVTDYPQNFIVDNAFYEENGQGYNIWGGSKTPSATNVSSYTQSATNPTQFTLSQPVIGNITSLLTALNAWTGTGEEYTQWFADTYNVNAYHPTLGEVEAPGIALSPASLNLYYRPIGSKMYPEKLTLTNTSDIPLTITDFSFTSGNSFFTFDGETPATPFTLEPGLIKKIMVTTDHEAAVTPGTVSTSLVMMYSTRGTKSIPVTAIAYQPSAPDVVELPTVISSFPFSSTQSTLSLHKNYNLPGQGTSGPDGVYKMTFATDIALTATLTGCNNPAMAIYKEDLGGKDYPEVDNYLYFGQDDITDVTIPAGTYYLVASATSSQYILNVSTATIPLPLEPTAISPYDGQINLEGTVALTFEKGKYATEYQILFGTTYPPTNIIQDWTNDFDANVTVDVNINQTYFWIVNQRNSSGTTEGPVWGFTSTFTKPGNLFCDTNYIYEGETAHMHWTAPSNRSFRGYNVYKDGVKINSSTITNLTYDVSGLTYNMASGYTFTVTAVYDEGESQPSIGDFIRVTGNGHVSGHVYEIDGTTPVANAAVTLNGNDEINNNQTYTFSTNAAGEFSHQVVAGNYTATAVKDGYMVGTHIGSIKVNYAQTTSFDVNIRESINPVGTVTAEVVGDHANISWSWEGERSFQYFNIYRKSCIFEGDPVLVATNVTAMTYNDTEFDNLPWNSYTYGVSAYYDGNHESSVKWEDRGITAYAIEVGNPTIGSDFTYGSFDVDAPRNLTPIVETTSIQCGSYGGNGIFYAYDIYQYFYKFDVTTGAILKRVFASCCFTDMTYDHTTNTMYGTFDGALYTINVETGEPTYIGNFNNELGVYIIQVLACDINGQLYGIAPDQVSGILFRINKETAEIENIGLTNVGCIYLQSGDFDKENNVFYWCGYNDDGGFFATVNTATGNATVYATGVQNRVSFFVPYDDPNPEIHESEVVWSNCIDKDMEVTLSVTVTTNNGELPEGTTVSFTSTTEPGIEYETILDADGTVTWNDFRKGSYLYSIKKDGFNSCAFNTTIDIFTNMNINCELEEATAPVENLHVSHTGWMSWDNPGENPYLEGDEFLFDFENGTTDGFTLLDADGDGYNWLNSHELGLANGYNSQYCITSQSYVNYVGPLYPNNYIITDQKYLIGTNSQLSWYVCAQDQYYAAEHYSVLVATAEHPSPDDFVAVFEETITSKSGKGERNGKDQGMWHSRVVDLSEYQGEEVWIAIRHHNCTDQYMIDIDDFKLYNTRSERFILKEFEVYQDGEMVATTEDNFYQLDVEGLTEGQTYTAAVVAVYQTGNSSATNFIWKYYECDNYEGVSSFNAVAENDNVVLTWNGVPDGNGNRDGQWFYYDNGECAGTVSGNFMWAIQVPKEELMQYPEYMLTKVSMFDAVQQEGLILIFQDGETTPGELIYQQVYNTKGTGVYTEFMMTDPVDIDVNKNLWIVIRMTGGNLAAPAMNSFHTWRGSMISFDGTTWQDISNLGYFLTWNLRAYIEENTWSLETRGIALFRDEVCITPEFLSPDETSFTDVAPEAGAHEYSIRVVKGETSHRYNWNSMSCPQTASVFASVEESCIDGVSIYPNPTKNILNVKGEDINNIKIYNALGQMIYVSDIENDMIEIDMSHFGTGMYMVTISSENGNTTRKVSVF